MKHTEWLVTALLASLLYTDAAEARGTILGHVRSLQHWSGIPGILVKLDETMNDLDSCGRTDWYIMPDAAAHAQFVQAMLLTAQTANRPVFITLDGCLEGMPAIFAIENSPPQ
ncbi:hypothetical protein A0J57_17610 [Sphingobium sp. 22B]|uniref:hypothetical protein n=1 Tax=unclassified Sphingobium TaxID=2611147 RepID=UPI00078313BC|nr:MULTISPECIES: hypothetical protein [unclassified Sphingobium]KXU31114.1 hypothetical protein AXW74_13890 [Sphingobium sp. AM]KYC30963.1 hypothetical protein A0J57_17610 [Sphingobium sp. 22B]OAP30495.1 hypothetical protein A8O16_17895 [Sphingobium sp. 20006FA]